MANYDMTQTLRDHRNRDLTEELPDPNSTQQNPLPHIISPITLGLALERAAMFGGKQDDTADDKFQAFKLAKVAATGGTNCELSKEQITKFKELAARIYTPVGYGAIVEALEHPGRSRIAAIMPAAPESAVEVAN